MQRSLDAMELDIDSIIKSRGRCDNAYVRVLGVLAALIVAVVVFDYFLASKSHTAILFETRQEGVADNEEVGETVVDEEGDVWVRRSTLERSA